MSQIIKGSERKRRNSSQVHSYHFQEKRLYWNLALSREQSPMGFLAMRRQYAHKQAEFKRRLGRRSQSFINNADPFKKVGQSGLDQIGFYQLASLSLIFKTTSGIQILSKQT